MTNDQKFFHTLLDQAVALAYTPSEAGEATWAESLALIHEAGDKAARLGLPHLVEKACRFKWLATPGEAQSFLAGCLAALSQSTPDAEPPADGLLSLKQAAAYLGYTAEGLREIVKRTRRGGRGPSIEFSQAGKRGSLRFRQEWLDRFVEQNRDGAGVPLLPKPKARKGPGRPAKASPEQATWDRLAQ
jgi:hypothetical protein